MFCGFVSVPGVTVWKDFPDDWCHHLCGSNGEFKQPRQNGEAGLQTFTAVPHIMLHTDLVWQTQGR